MEFIKYMATVLLVLINISLFGQVNNPLTNDITTSFKVSGACSMCKERIEKAAKIKGVK